MKRVLALATAASFLAPSQAMAVVKPGLDPMQLAQMEAAMRRAQVRLRVSSRGKTPPPHVG